VAWYRDSDDGESTDAVIDAWLLRQFPGRTLDELDSMDYARYLRALEAKQISDVEQMRRLYLSKDAPKEQDADIWKAIQAHDRLLDDDK
jgi:hypothetical protein